MHGADLDRPEKGVGGVGGHQQLRLVVRDRSGAMISGLGADDGHKNCKINCVRLYVARPLSQKNGTLVGTAMS
jgi:hypothetical protein